jgi:S1-C subfamily serine protease
LVAPGRLIVGSDEDPSAITGFDGNAVTSTTALTDQLDRHRPGDTVTVTWFDRYGQSHEAQ